MKTLKIRLISTVLVIALTASCSAWNTKPPDGEPAGPVQSGDASPAPDENTNTEDNAGYTPSDSLFSLRFDPKASLNPLYSMSVSNADLWTLMYEGLFRLSPDLEAVPVLCESYTCEGGLVYTFTIRQGIICHDGQELKAADVEYSIDRAAHGKKYENRLTNVRAVHASGPYTLRLVLRNPDYLLPTLLDIPIIRQDSIAKTVPEGTGPYRLTEEKDGWVLEAWESHRDFASLPVQRIYLKTVEDGYLARSFATREIDLLTRDLTGPVTLNLYAEYETRYMNTSSLVFFGFNTRRGAGADRAVRRAISALIDPVSLSQTCFKGTVTASPLVLSPALGGYDRAWEEFLPADYEALRDAADLRDTDNDGFWDRSKGARSLSITVLVNDENAYKVRAAERLTELLFRMGFRAETKSLPFEEYTKALEAGQFDIFIGEALLMPNMDLSPLLKDGGKLNYFGSTDGKYGTLIDAVFAADTAEARSLARQELCRYCAEEAVIIPVCYKNKAVMTHPGVISGIDPSPSGVFTGIADWTIYLDQKKEGDS